MESALGIALVVAVVFGTTSCKQIKSGVNSFTKGFEEGLARRAGSGPEALPDSESLAGVDGLPVVSSFQTVTPATFAHFTGAGDRISVVEFYSDT